MNEDMYTLTDQPIIPDEVTQKVMRRSAGAVTLFLGTVREWTKGKRTDFLEYEAYPTMAIAQLKRIGQEALDRWPDVITAVTHRVGRLDISDIAVAIAVSSPHRKAAYEANEFIIERIKQIVPIWKKEHGDDGSVWIGDQSGAHEYREGRPLIDDTAGKIDRKRDDGRWRNNL
ncbi:molybdenum cofactor biosynthesis protein MoaE [Gorillibacterium massiliense]|uniref:molybdenum cofactor biosynthesis protein MoaE n=1 Tax=Gorillibacterium massiliense TaxID=1280390 RepID=UPI0004B85EF7|nr:molybdenum cofactor biosynthesis protein MoaE [Gorillibacterium massiliense]